MNPRKITDYDYINFLIGTQRVYSCTEAQRVNPDKIHGPAHDAYTRHLHRSDSSPEKLWEESKEHVVKNKGVLIVDDATLDKPYSKKIALVKSHWSGKHKRVVSGINLVTLLWSDGERYIPIDYRIYNKACDKLSKNDHFRAMLKTAHERQFSPEYILFDSWYASLKDLKHIRSFQWLWLTRLKSNRHVNIERTGSRPVSEIIPSDSGSIVHLKGYGLIKIFRKVRINDDAEYWATNDLDMGELQRLKYAELSWMIENYHRGIKQFTGIERCQARSEEAQRCHINLALRAFLRLEYHCFVMGLSWFEAKTSIVREAVRTYLTRPLFTLDSPPLIS